jgi:Barstar (barnase inhibitor)
MAQLVPFLGRENGLGVDFGCGHERDVATNWRARKSVTLGQGCGNMLLSHNQNCYRFIQQSRNGEGAMQIYTLDCANVKSEAEFWTLYLDVLKPEGKSVFGRNLDAFNDALWGGPGWPDASEIRVINTRGLKTIRHGQFYKSLVEITDNQTQVRFDWGKRSSTDTLIWGFVFAGACVMMATFLGVNVFAYNEMTLASAVKREGVAATARKLSITETKSIKTTSTRTVTYRYQVVGQPAPFTQTRLIDLNTFNRTNTRDEIEINYVRSSPNQSDVVGNDMAFFVMLLAGVVDVVILVGGVAFALSNRQRKRQSKSGAATST